MFHNREVLGVLSVQAYGEAEVYDEYSVELLSLVATQVAVAVVNADLYETMEKREKEKQRLYYSLTHDLLSFVSPISGYGEMLRMGTAEEFANRKDDIAKSILNCVKKITRFVEDILIYSKLEAGKLTIHAHPVGLNWLIAQSASNFFSELSMRRLELYIDGAKCDLSKGEIPRRIIGDGAGPDLVAKCDQMQIERVLNNCIHNAVKHAKTRLEITTALKDGEILCTVSDDGGGMDEELAPKVFDEYFQGHIGKKGVGLGLPSVKRIVEQHGGKVWVKTAPGKGFSFTFSLPPA
jgi:signal transduction histidine kinase